MNGAAGIVDSGRKSGLVYRSARGSRCLVRNAATAASHVHRSSTPGTCPPLTTPPHSPSQKV